MVATLRSASLLPPGAVSHDRSARLYQLAQLPFHGSQATATNSNFVAASSVGKWPLVRKARRNFEFNASMAFVCVDDPPDRLLKRKNRMTSFQLRRQPVTTPSGSGHVNAFETDRIAFNPSPKRMIASRWRSSSL